MSTVGSLDETVNDSMADAATSFPTPLYYMFPSEPKFEKTVDRTHLARKVEGGDRGFFQVCGVLACERSNEGFKLDETSQVSALGSSKLEFS